MRNVRILEKKFQNSASKFDDCIAFLENQLLRFEKQKRKLDECSFCYYHTSTLFNSTILEDKLIISLKIQHNDLLVSVYIVPFPRVTPCCVDPAPPSWQTISAPLVIPGLVLYKTYQNIRGVSFHRQLADKIITSISNFLPQSNC